MCAVGALLFARYAYPPDEPGLSGPTRPEAELSWAAEGSARMRRPAPGELVSVHADWACDVLTDEQAERISALEREQRESLALALSTLSEAGSG